MLVIFALLGYLNIRLHRQHLEAATLASAERVSDVIKRSTTYYMLRNDREGLYHAIQTMADEPGMVKVRIFDQEGRISYSTDPAEVSHVLDKSGGGLLRLPHPIAAAGAPESSRPLSHLSQWRRTPGAGNYHSHRKSTELLERRMPRASRQPASSGRAGHKSFAGENRRATRGQQRTHAVLHGRRNVDGGGVELVVRVASGRQTYQGAQERHGTSFRRANSVTRSRCDPRTKSGTWPIPSTA